MANTISPLPASLEALVPTSRDKKSDGKNLGQEAFLELMITQLKNQDPMKPMESGEFLSQIAQFSTVNGIGELQNSFSMLASSLQSSQALQASTMVGRKVLVASDAVVLMEGQDARLAIELPSAASGVQLSFKDAFGQLVRQVNLGARGEGLTDFVWDGLDALGNRLLPGRYTVDAVAGIDGEPVALATLVQAPVESVTLPRNGQAPILNLTNYGAVQLDAIKRVL